MSSSDATLGTGTFASTTNTYVTNNDDCPAGTRKITVIRDPGNTLRISDIKVTLKAYSLIKILGNEECDRINMHRLLQQVVKDTLKSEQQGWVDICVQIMNEQIFTDFSTVEYRNRFINMYPHISTITQYLFSNRSEEIANLHFFLGKGLGESADYTEALEYHKKSLVIREKVLGEEHSNTAASYNELGWVYHSLGIYEKALESHQKALTIRKKVCGIDHSDTATSYNDIGWIYFLLGSYERALEYLHNTPIARRTRQT